MHPDAAATRQTRVRPSCLALLYIHKPAALNGGTAHIVSKGRMGARPPDGWTNCGRSRRCSGDGGGWRRHLLPLTAPTQGARRRALQLVCVDPALHLVRTAVAVRRVDAQPPCWGARWGKGRRGRKGCWRMTLPNCGRVAGRGCLKKVPQTAHTDDPRKGCCAHRRARRLRGLLQTKCRRTVEPRVQNRVARTENHGNCRGCRQPCTPLQRWRWRWQRRWEWGRGAGGRRRGNSRRRLSRGTEECCRGCDRW